MKIAVLGGNVGLVMELLLCVEKSMEGRWEEERCGIEVRSGKGK